MKVLLIGASGYCGSYLRRELGAAGFEVWGLDKADSEEHIGCDYRDFDEYFEELEDADAVLFFAGRSSVPLAKEDPQDTISANITSLIKLRQRMPPRAYLLYASSASVYTKPGGGAFPAKEDDLVCPNTNVYDVSKFAFDYIQQAFFQNSLGLRMGTVSGYGCVPKPLREELVFNSMNLSAIRNGYIQLANPFAARSILFLPDLAAIVKACLEQRPTGVLNAFSLNVGMGQLATGIAAYHGCGIRNLPDSPTYSFNMDDTKLRSLVHLDPISIWARCKDFEIAWEQANPPQ